MYKAFLFILLTTTIYGQTHLNEKQVIDKQHIDFSKEVIYFELSGQIEIDGHIFLNDTCKNPIIYTANLEEVTLFRKNNPEVKYKVRKCSIEECKIIHLTNKTQDWVYPKMQFYNNIAQ